MRGVRVLLIVLVTAIAAVALVGCGGDDDEGATETTTETTETDTTATGSRLIGTVGSEDEPDAYVITLTTEDGSAVTTLPAGDYTLEINDLSSIHNFHLSGPGNVDVMSEVDEIEDEDYDVTLQAGTYDFVCDPHAGQMNGSFEVSG
jgi:plastocyanin